MMNWALEVRWELEVKVPCSDPLRKWSLLAPGIWGGSSGDVQIPVRWGPSVVAAEVQGMRLVPWFLS